MGGMSSAAMGQAELADYYILLLLALAPTLLSSTVLLGLHARKLALGEGALELPKHTMVDPAGLPILHRLHRAVRAEETVNIRLKLFFFCLGWTFVCLGRGVLLVESVKLYMEEKLHIPDWLLPPHLEDHLPAPLAASLLRWLSSFITTMRTFRDLGPLCAMFALRSTDRISSYLACGFLSLYVSIIAFQVSHFGCLPIVSAAFLVPCWLIALLD